MKRFLCLILPAFMLCTGFNVPSSFHQKINQSNIYRCGGYINVNQSTSSFDPVIRNVIVWSDQVFSYPVPDETNPYLLPVILSTGNYYIVEASIRLPFTNNAGDVWILELKRFDGTIAKKIEYTSTTNGSGFASIRTSWFAPECITYQLFVRKK